MPMPASLPGSNMIVDTHVEKLFFQLSQEAKHWSVFWARIARRLMSVAFLFRCANSIPISFIISAQSPSTQGGHGDGSGVGGSSSNISSTSEQSPSNQAGHGDFVVVGGSSSFFTGGAAVVEG